MTFLNGRSRESTCVSCQVFLEVMFVLEALRTFRTLVTDTIVVRNHMRAQPGVVHTYLTTHLADL